MARIYDEKVDLDYEATRAFFSKRAEAASERGVVGATAYQDDNPTLAVERDRHEKNTAMPLLGVRDGMKALEIGSGTGRWAEAFEDREATYLGLDYSEELVEVAVRRFAACRGTMKFQVMSATDLAGDRLAVPPPFDLILLSGLFIYLNDRDFDALVAKLPGLCSDDARLYVRDPISVIDTRLTLRDFYSEELRTEYNAIYRTDSEYLRAFDEHLAPSGFMLERAEFLFPEELCNREETKQKYYLLTRTRA